MATVGLPESIRALYPFKPHFVTLSDGQQMHYVDEGPPDGEVLVFAHGYPTWSFAYRAFLIYYAAQGYRCIAVDHVGFGQSAKPAARRYHMLRRHIHNLLECLTALDVRDITLVMEDWGGPMGLGYAIRRRENVRRLVIMNAWGFQDTFTHPRLPLVKWVTRPGVGELLLRTMNLAINVGIQRWTVRELSSSVLTGYRSPFRDAHSRAALTQFPRMINVTSAHPSATDMREIEQGLAHLRSIPTLLLWGAENPFFPPDIALHWKKMLPRARGPVMIEQAGHFLTEDAPDRVIQHLDAFLERV